jgi:hypothetical protein
VQLQIIETWYSELVSYVTRQVGMLIILNSDVLYTNVFVHKRVHQNWRRFAEGCRSVNAELIFPRTALYEIELRQQELYDFEIKSIGNASALLQKYGIQFNAPIPEKLITAPNIVQLFKDTGATVRVEIATLEDFQDAERRAAMHLPPAAPRTPPTDKQATDDSDEMRDLVIWAVACRLAVTHGGALLLSRDKVHTGRLGRAEADEKGLQIAIEFDEALGMLGAETEAGKIASAFLSEAWNELRKKGLPLREQFGVKTIIKPIFVQGENGLASARFSFTCAIDRDKRFSAMAEVSDIQENHFHLKISDAHVDKNLFANGNFEIQVSRHGAPEANDLEERLGDLRKILR